MSDRLDDQSGTVASRHGVRIYADDATVLGPLFTDPDARGARRWSHMFDPNRCDRAEDVALSTIFPQLGGLPASQR